MNENIDMCLCSVFPKGWYHGAPPPFNFKVYTENTVL